jgi:hypothetical protein
MSFAMQVAENTAIRSLQDANLMSHELVHCHLNPQLTAVKSWG